MTPDVVVHVIDLPGTAHDDLEPLLSDDERARARRFAFERDRQAYTITRGVLRTVLGRATGVAPQRLVFEYGRHGKPSLAASAGPRVEFNVSHSRRHAVVAVSAAGAVGVDVEDVRTLDDRDALARRTFASEESAAIEATDATARDRAFFACWTRKEAFVKATGLGLSFPLDRFVVSVDPGAAAPLIGVDGSAAEARAWTLADLPVGPGAVGALAIRRPAAVIACQPWQAQSITPARRRRTS
jgi:4'-phosphopantetheinyl transferase